MEFTILHLFLLFPFALSSSSESVQSVESFERALEGLKSSDTRSMGSDTAGKEHFHPVRGDKGSDVGSLDKKVTYVFNKQIDYSNTYWGMQMSSVNMLLSPCLES